MLLESENIKERPYYLGIENNKIIFQLKQEKKCLCCHSSLFKKRSTAKFCSDKCRLKSHNLLKTKTIKPKLYLVK
jgi:hypothetical protein